MILKDKKFGAGKNITLENFREGCDNRAPFSLIGVSTRSLNLKTLYFKLAYSQ